MGAERDATTDAVCLPACHELDESGVSEVVTWIRGQRGNISSGSSTDQSWWRTQVCFQGVPKAGTERSRFTDQTVGVLRRSKNQSSSSFFQQFKYIEHDSKLHNSRGVGQGAGSNLLCWKRHTGIGLRLARTVC